MDGDRAGFCRDQRVAAEGGHGVVAGVLVAQKLGQRHGIGPKHLDWQGVGARKASSSSSGRVAGLAAAAASIEIRQVVA